MEMEQRDPLPPFHDASPGVCAYELSVMDVLQGLTKARTYGFFQDFKTGRFNFEEYEHFEMVENGDLNWIIEGQFLAFAGPQNRREVSREGYVTLTPEDYVDYFVKRNVGLVVRLNKKCYEETKFQRFGIAHAEHYYLDGSCPSKTILNHVVQSFEKCIFELPYLRRTGKGVAVHCKAGLGRTGTCIGAFMMKHYKFTAAEAIGWMRLCRPGMVIGPQQHFLQDIEQEMWHDGEVMRLRVRRALENSKINKGRNGVPPLDYESPEKSKTASSDKKKRRSPRLKLSTTGFKNAFHSMGMSSGHDEVNPSDEIMEREGNTSQGDALRAAHSRSLTSPNKYH
jgi:cell division cycle 14